MNDEEQLEMTQRAQERQIGIESKTQTARLRSASTASREQPSSRNQRDGECKPSPLRLQRIAFHR